MTESEVGATVVLYDPRRSPPEYEVEDVIRAQTEWGPENTVTLEQSDGEEHSFSYSGVCISGFDISDPVGSE